MKYLILGVILGSMLVAVIPIGERTAEYYLREAKVVTLDTGPQPLGKEAYPPPRPSPPSPELSLASLGERRPILMDLVFTVIISLIPSFLLFLVASKFISRI